MAGVLIRKGNLNTDTCIVGRWPCEDRHMRMPWEGGWGDWSGISISQGISRIVGHHWKLWEKHGIDSSSELSEGTSPAYTLISDF